MKNDRHRPARNTALALLAAVLAALALAPALGAAEMTKRQAKEVIAEAGAAAAKGDPVKARELYQLVAASTTKLPERRAEALYRLVLLEAALPAASREGDLFARSTAEFLDEFPKDEKRPVIAAIAGLAAEKQAKEAEIAALETRIAAGELVRKEDAAAGAKDAAKRTEELELKLRRSLVENELLKAELAKKDEALAKLKKVVVGGG